MAAHGRFELSVFGAVVAVLLCVASVSAYGGEREKSAVPRLGAVVVNEYMLSANSVLPTAWVELYNKEDVAMNVEGYYLGFTPGNLQVVRLTSAALDSTLIPPRGHLVVPVPLHIVRGLIDTGDHQLRFLDPSREVVLDTVSYKPQSTEARKSYSRSPDGSFWSSELTTPTPGAANEKLSGTWSGNFEIHVFDVGQGDSQLIIFPSGYTILVDVFEENWNSDNGGEAVAARIREITGGSHINAGVISHLHLDHLGYAGYGGFWHLIEEEGIVFDLIVDRDAGVWQDWNKDGVCDPDTEILWHTVGTFSGTAQNWLCYATDPRNEKIYDVREVARLCSTTQINPPDEGAEVEIITVDALGAYLEDGVTPITGNYSTWPVPPSENDYSIGIKITYKNISYVTMGDLDGEYDVSSYGYTYNDVEAAVKHRIGEVDIYHVNHHGSSHSSSPGLLETLKPQLSLISCGVDNSYGHPEQEVLDRLLAEGSVYLTSDCDTANNYYHAVRLNSDILVVSADGNEFTVAGAGRDQPSSFTGRGSPRGTCP